MFDILKQIFDAIKGFFEFSAEAVSTLIDLVTAVYTFFTQSFSLAVAFFPTFWTITILLCVIIAIVYKIIGR